VGGRLVPVPDLDYFNAREVQEERLASSGVALLHGHVVLRRSSGAVLVLSERKVRALLVEHGFGRKMTLKAISGEAAASYLTKSIAVYVTKSVDARGGVECVRDGQLWPWKGRLWTSSRAWSGVTKPADVVRLAAGQPLVSFSDELCGETEGDVLAKVLKAFPGGEVLGPAPPDDGLSSVVPGVAAIAQCSQGRLWV
jgi:hypothetical protein